MSNNNDLLASQADSAFHAENTRYLGERAELMNSADPGVFDRINQRIAGGGPASISTPAAPPPASPVPAPPPPLLASVGSAPATAASLLATRDYGELSSLERMRLADEAPEAFAKNRADWERRGCPGPGQGMPAQALGYEHWNNQQRAVVAARDPDRFTAARNDWLARGEPEPPEAA